MRNTTTIDNICAAASQEDKQDTKLAQPIETSIILDESSKRLKFEEYNITRLKYNQKKSPSHRYMDVISDPEKNKRKESFEIEKQDYENLSPRQKIINMILLARKEIKTENEKNNIFIYKSSSGITPNYIAIGNALIEYSSTDGYEYLQCYSLKKPETVFFAIVNETQESPTISDIFPINLAELFEHAERKSAFSAEKTNTSQEDKYDLRLKLAEVIRLATNEKKSDPTIIITIFDTWKRMKELQTKKMLANQVSAKTETETETMPANQTSTIKTLIPECNPKQWMNTIHMIWEEQQKMHHMPQVSQNSGEPESTMSALKK
jgi:hypothetical protein